MRKASRFLIVISLFTMCIPQAQARFFQEAATTTFTYTDGDFASGWVDIVVVVDDSNIVGTGPATASGSVALETSRGNPGALRASTHNMVYGDRLLTGGRNTNASYNPQSAGAINILDFSIDLIDLQESVTGRTGWLAVVEQGGIVYYSTKGQVFNTATWKSFYLQGLTSLDFDANPNGSNPQDKRHPDFTTAGEPITFGYVVTNSLTGTSTTRTAKRGVDNWSVTINPVRLYLPLVEK